MHMPPHCNFRKCEHQNRYLPPIYIPGAYEYQRYNSNRTCKYFQLVRRTKLLRVEARVAKQPLRSWAAEEIVRARERIW